MTQYGPLHNAPNPLQRLFARSAFAGAVFFGVVMGAFCTLPFVFGGAPIRSIALIGVGGFALMTIFMFVSARGRDLAAERVWRTTWYRNSRVRRTCDRARPRDRGVLVRRRSARSPGCYARRTLAGSVVRGRVDVGAGLALPLWADRPLIQLVQLVREQS